MATPGHSPLSLQLFKVPLVSDSIPSTLYHQPIILASLVYPSVNSPALPILTIPIFIPPSCISSVVDILTLQTAHSGPQAAMAIPGPPPQIFTTPSISASILLTPTHRIAAIAGMASSSRICYNVHMYDDEEDDFWGDHEDSLYDDYDRDLFDDNDNEDEDEDDDSLDDFDIEEAGSLDGDSDARISISKYSGYGSSIDLDKLTDHQRNLYDLGYESGHDSGLDNSLDDLDDDSLF